MPSLLAKFKKSKKDKEQDVLIQEKPPEFKLFTQTDDETEPTEVDVFASSGLPTTRFSGMSLSEKSTSVAPPIDKSADVTSSPSASSISNHEPRPSNTTTPVRSNSKRLSARLSSLVRRPSQMSKRSRSSSYVPDFKPIDPTTDIESQWEERATMLATAGPPSPAIPRSDTVFNLAGPPRIPSMQFGPTTLKRSNSDKQSTLRPDLHTPSKPTLQRNSSSVQRPSGKAIAEEVTYNYSAMSKDDLLQAAIKEHESGNLEQSTQLFKKSAQGSDGLAIGQLMYGLSLRHGWGIQADEAKAIHWLRQAATASADHERQALSAGHLAGGQMKGDLTLAIFELGNCFRHGWGVEVDKALAFQYYETAANLGDLDAMFETAWSYETGFGTKKNKFRAAWWYRKHESAGPKTPGMQWIWKPKYDSNPFA